MKTARQQSSVVIRPVITSHAYGVVQERLDAQPRDWDRYTSQAAEFHLRNARKRASAAAGADLAVQIDPDFILGPRALDMAANR